MGKFNYNTVDFKSVIRSRGQGEPVNEESPSVLETGCWRNPSEGDFKESATENNRLFIRVRMKRCGKSAPPLR